MKDKKENFSFDTIKDFDNHIAKSIPLYNDLQNIVEKISNFFVVSDTNVYDVGCSTGNLLKKIKIQKDCKKYGLDISKNLLPTNTEECTFLEIDIANFKFYKSSFIYSLFTLQFLPIFKRQDVLRSVYDGLLQGGGFLLAEKIFYENSTINAIVSSLYYEFKNINFTAQEILNKEFDLRYIMRPLTTKENICLLKNAGFSNVEIIKKDYQFEVYLCIK